MDLLLRVRTAPRTSSAGKHSRFPLRVRSWLGPDDDLDIPAERIEKAVKALHREAIQVASQEEAPLGLIDPQYLSSLGLSQMPMLDDARDLSDQVGLQQENIGIRQTHVGEDVSTAFRETRCIAHPSPFMEPYSDWFSEDLLEGVLFPTGKVIESLASAVHGPRI